MMWDDDRAVDELIDDVAREMTASRAPRDAGEFRANVIVRLDERRPRRWMWIVSPVAVSALLIIAVLVFGRGNRASETVVRAPETSALQPQTQPTAPPVDLTTHPGTLAPGTLAPGTLAPGTLAPGTLAPGTLAPGTLAPGTLVPGTLAPGTRHPDTLAPSEIDALAPPPLAVDSIALMEIEQGKSIRVPQLETIAPITVEPIGEPQGERP